MCAARPRYEDAHTQHLAEAGQARAGRKRTGLGVSVLGGIGRASRVRKKWSSSTTTCEA